jgi:hypothetical protein
VVEAHGDVFFIRLVYITYGLPVTFTVALAEDPAPTRKKQFVRICSDDWGKKFENIFELGERRPESKQPFFVNV